MDDLSYHDAEEWAYAEQEYWADEALRSEMEYYNGLAAEAEAMAEMEEDA